MSANREPFIENGQVDIVVATYTINDKRKEVIDFAGPYFVAGQSILVLEDNDDIESEDDLVGQPVCSVTGSTPARQARRDRRRAGHQTDTYSNCLEPLRSGQAVAVSTDNVILAGLVAQGPGEFKIVGEPFTEEPYGIGLARATTTSATSSTTCSRSPTRTARTRRRGTPPPAPCSSSPSRPPSTGTDRSDPVGRTVLPDPGTIRSAARRADLTIASEGKWTPSSTACRSTSRVSE